MDEKSEIIQKTSQQIRAVCDGGGGQKFQLTFTELFE